LISTVLVEKIGGINNMCIHGYQMFMPQRNNEVSIIISKDKLFNIETKIILLLLMYFLEFY